LKTVLFIFFIVFNTTVFGQTKSPFILIDSATNEPIKYAEIANYSNKKVLSFTNELGGFYINKLKQNGGAIFIKCLGYKSKVVSNLNDSVILLVSLINELNTVIIRDINFNTVFLNCLEKLKENENNKHQFKSFFKLFSSKEEQIYEVIEGFYSTEVKPNKIEKISLENGRYAFKDSVLKEEFLLSENLSKLIVNLNTLSSKNPLNIPLSIIPFYDFNEAKFVTKTVTKTFFDGTEKVIEYQIIPKEKYKRKIFSCIVWIGQKTFNIKKLSLTIQYPQKQILEAISPNSICNIDSISITQIFSENYANISLPEQIEMVFYYQLINNEKTSQLTTRINLVNFEENKTIVDLKLNDNLTDREKIEHILYVPNYWQNASKYYYNTNEQNNQIEALEKLNLFGNPLLTNADTLKYVADQYLFCKQNAGPFIKQNTKPLNSLGITILKRNNQEVAEFYFDLHFLYAFYNNKFYYRILPLFDAKHSWCSQNTIEEAITNKFLSELNDLTIHFCGVLNNKVNEFEKNEIKLEQLLIEKERIIEKYYLAQEELIKKLWL